MQTVMDVSDFNDLQKEQGRDVVKEQVLNALNAAPLQSPAPSVGESDFEEKIPDDIRHFNDDESGFYSKKELLDHFWYIYNTDTCWDNIERQQMKLSHLNLLVGKDTYKYWREHAKRRVVMELQFEPGHDLGKKYVNLYDGFEFLPHARGVEGCERILTHVNNLCRERENEALWLLRWLAYPLQNPGAKMATSVIMYGSEGPGKSVLFERVMRKIYGRYGTTIGQAQLESDFTGWQGQKLFALAEEVVSRSERSHHKGQLKHLVTGSTLMINEKMLPVREESNHINFVFLSNSTIPLELDHGDRRYLVLYVDGVPGADYFSQLFEEINGDGVACFYQALLSMDMADFGPHTKPPVNEEKENLVSMSLPSPIHFHNLWRDGEEGDDYGCATSADLFSRFKIWAEKNGEFKRTERFFGGEIKRVMRQVRLNIKHPDYSKAVKTHRVYVTDEMYQKKDEEGWILAVAKQCNAFHANNSQTVE